MRIGLYSPAGFTAYYRGKSLLLNSNLYNKRAELVKENYA